MKGAKASPGSAHGQPSARGPAVALIWQIQPRRSGGDDPSRVRSSFARSSPSGSTATNTDHSRRQTLLVDNMGRRPVSQWLLFPSEVGWYRLQGDPQGVTRRHDGRGVSSHYD